MVIFFAQDKLDPHGRENILVPSCESLAVARIPCGHNKLGLDHYRLTCEAWSWMKRITHMTSLSATDGLLPIKTGYASSCTRR
jgi:hypothetical protein